ncbi:hypothetical protein YC2023_081904 [Brassica napus]
MHLLCLLQVSNDSHRSPTSVLRFNVKEETYYNTELEIKPTKLSLEITSAVVEDSQTLLLKCIVIKCFETDLIFPPFYLLLISACKTSINKTLIIIQIGNLQLLKK